MTNAARSMRITWICVSGFTLLYGANDAHAQDRGGPAPLTIPARIGPDARLVMERLADSLKLSGLPYKGVYSKAAEGVLKGATDERIVSAVRTLAKELGAARSALGATATDAELEAGASALHVGATAESLRMLADRHAKSARGSNAVAGANSLAFPLLALSDLVTRGVRVGTAVDAITMLVTGGARESDYTALRAATAQGTVAGKGVDQIVIDRARALVGRHGG